MELTKTPRDARRGALPAAARLAPRGASLPDAGVVLPAMEIAMSGGDSRVLALKAEPGREAALPPGALDGPHAGPMARAVDSPAARP